MNRFAWATVCAVILAVFTVTIANADVGDVVLCRSSDGSSTHSDVMNSSGLLMQTFLMTESTNVSGVKLPITRVSGTSTFDVYIFPTTDGGSGVLVPNMPAGALASISNVSTAVLPLATGTSTDQGIECNSTDRAGQVFEFDTPAFLTQGTTYAIVVDDGTGAEWNVELTAIIGNVYPQGYFERCNDVLFNCSTVPSDWIGGGGGQGDESAFVVFGTIVTPEVERDIYSWLANFLAAIGMDSTVGKLLIGAGFALILLLALLLLKIPFLLALGFGGIISIVLVSAMLISEAAFLVMISLVGIGILGRLILGSGGEATD